MKEHYYRDTVYLWMALYLLPLFGSIVMMILIAWGGENSHLHYILQGELNGSPIMNIPLKEILPMFYVCMGSSMFMQFLFTKERAEIMPKSVNDQLILNLMLASFISVLFVIIASVTPLEIHDEFPGFKEVIGISLTWFCYTWYIFLFTIFHVVKNLLPAARKLDVVNSVRKHN